MASAVRAWEYRVAAELLRDPASVIVVDDIGRLKDAAAFDHLGRLLCGIGGNSVPEFRTGPGDAALVAASDALFVLTSDLECARAPPLPRRCCDGAPPLLRLRSAAAAIVLRRCRDCPPPLLHALRRCCDHTPLSCAHRVCDGEDHHALGSRVRW